MDIPILGIMLLSIVVAGLLIDRADTKRNLYQRKILKTVECRAAAKRLGRIVERLGLYDATFPPVDSGLYSKVVDLYDCYELIPYSTPVEAIDRHNMYWTRANFEDDELIILWLEGVIETPKT